MYKLISASLSFVRSFKVIDIASFKLCLFSLGLLVGVNIKKTDKKAITAFVAVVFIATYLYLMIKLILHCLSAFDYYNTWDSYGEYDSIHKYI